MSTSFIKSSAILIMVLLSGFTMADVKVVVHSSVPDGSITADQAADIFLGKVSNLPSGHKTVPVDQGEGERARNDFYEKVAKKDAAQLKAYWSRLIFTGKGQPPKELSDDAEVLQLVSSNPNIVGYVSGNASTAGVKVLLTVH